MPYDFDQLISRNNTGSLKYDFASERGKPEGLLPLWVADMDIQAPREVRAALRQAAEHGIYGYSDTRADYTAALQSWFSRRFAFDIQPEWLVKTPGIVFAIAAAIRALTKEGDAILIQQPVYYPFADKILANHRRCINNPLVYENGRYHINFADFESKIVENNVKMFILCSPHNPVGRVWTRDELQRMGDICLKHHCLVVSDEIHCDFVFPGHQHHIFASLSPAFLNHSIVMTAPSKSFNLAGLQTSNIFIANPEYRSRFQEEMRRAGVSQLNQMGLVACQAAYTYGESWLEQLRVYLEKNLRFVREFLHTRLPAITLVEPEGTYLLWLDCRALGLSATALDQFMIEKAGLWLDDGCMFGEEGAQFQRINIACPRATLEKALLQLEHAVHTL